jgi:hypothetical protein
MRYNGATMRSWSQPRGTSADTIRRFGDLGNLGDDPAAAAKAWTAAGFDDEEAVPWLEARCFDPEAARELAELGVTPKQASARTRDGRRDYRDTLGFKVASGDLSPRQGAARASSSR